MARTHRWAASGLLALSCAGPTTPAEPAAAQVPATTERRVLTQRASVGATYQVHAENRGLYGGDVLTLDLQVTVTSFDADQLVVEVLLERGLRNGSQEMFRDVRFELTLPFDPNAPPAGTTGDDSPNRFVFREPQPDEGIGDVITGFFPTFAFDQCRFPHEPHRAGDEWKEPLRLWFYGDVTVAWKAGGLTTREDGEYARYNAVWYSPLEAGGPAISPIFNVDLDVRTDDGHVGTCEVTSRILDAHGLPTYTRITSRRIGP